MRIHSHDLFESGNWALVTSANLRVYCMLFHGAMGTTPNDLEQFLATLKFLLEQDNGTRHRPSNTDPPDGWTCPFRSACFAHLFVLICRWTTTTNRLPILSRPRSNLLLRLISSIHCSKAQRSPFYLYWFSVIMSHDQTSLLLVFDFKEINKGNVTGAGQEPQMNNFSGCDAKLVTPCHHS